VVKSLADAAVKSMPGTMTAPAKDEMTQKIAEAMKDTLPEVMAKAEAQPASEPVRLKLGQFRDQDRFHRGTGTATIYSLADGPDLRVILTRSQNPEEAGQITGPGQLELAKLKGNMGNHNYPIPNDADVYTFNSVVVFCKPFRVIFSVASLESAG
ncbi:MAG: DM13 domain-containing protein, partial [Dehalococcoidia bacterium]